MSSQLLLLLKFSLLALLYLFLLRVVRAVWAELGSPPAEPSSPVPSAAPPVTVGRAAAPVVSPPLDAPGRGRGVPKASPPTGAVQAVDAVVPGRLVVVSPPSQAGAAVAIPSAGVLVGRGPGCDLVLDDSYVSQRHLRVSAAGSGGWLVEDLGSTNGTFVGGQRVVAPRVVGRGEPVSIGGVVVEVR